MIQMVARDGIEPPTPAFSGPRSTTELPGLSEDFQLRILRGIRHGRKKVGWSTFSALQRLTQYINSHSGKPIGPKKVAFPRLKFRRFTRGLG